MDFSFVILNWNSKDHIVRCLDSISSTIEANYRYEIFVVDNGSVDGSVDWLKQKSKEWPETLKPIFLSENTGTTYSRNLALKASTGKYLVVLDSDVELRQGNLTELVSVLDSNARAGMVVPKLAYGSGMLQKSTDVFPTLLRKVERLFFLKSIEEREAKAALRGEVAPVDYAISAFWLFPRTVLDDVGLLDEKIFYAPEDVDFCIRIWKAGYQILYVPHVEATHYAQEISRGFKFNKAKWEHIKGLFYYFIKHRYFLRRPNFSARVSDASRTQP